MWEGVGDSEWSGGDCGRVGVRVMMTVMMAARVMVVCGWEGEKKREGEEEEEELLGESVTQ